MPKATFTSEHRPTSRDNFPKLKLVKDEKARIVFLEDPTYNYVHTLRAPKIVNGEAITEEVEKGYGDNKTVVEDYVLDFISNPLCLGDEGLIKDKRGLDPKNCPICAAAQENPDIFRSPDKRYAVNVAKYATKPGSFELRSPFAVEIQIWGFSEFTWGKLFDIVSDLDDEDIKKVDLLLGPCEVEKFQKYDIRPSTKKAAYLAAKELTATTAETYKNNKASDEDLDRACGRKLDRKLIETDIDTVKYRWAIARRSDNRDERAEESQLSSLSDDLEGMLSGDDSKSDDVDAIEALSEDSDSDDVDVEDFDSILKNL
jgi:hypothetical protein